MINLVIDLSNMFFRSTFTVGGYGKNQYTFHSQKEMDQLMRKVATDISSIIRQAHPGRAAFALDSRSWRKDIPIDENEGYKGNREKSEFINWDNVYSIMDEFGEIAKSRGMIVSKIKNAEADDLIALWAEEFIKGGEHVIIVSGDEDMRQLVREENGKFVTVFNPFVYGKNGTRKLYAPSGFAKWLETEESVGSIFDRGIDVDKEDFSSLLNDKTKKVKLEIIDSNEILMSKVFCGDKGDNVPAIYSWIKEDEKGGIKIEKAEKITPSKMKKILDKINPIGVEDLLKEKNLESIFNDLKTISKTFPPFKMRDRMMRQIKLVALKRDIFPSEIVEAFNSSLKTTDLSKLSASSISMNSILEGTKYIDSNYKRQSNESSIFQQIDQITNKELF